MIQAPLAGNPESSSAVPIQGVATPQEYAPAPQVPQTDFANIPFETPAQQTPFTPFTPPENQYQTEIPAETNTYTPNSEVQHFSADEYPQQNFAPTQEAPIAQEYSPFVTPETQPTFQTPEYQTPQAETQNFTPEYQAPFQEYQAPAQELAPAPA